MLKPGGRLALVAWGKQDQPMFSMTSGIVMKYVSMPPPDPDAPNLFMFGEPGRLERTLKSAGFENVHEEARSVRGVWKSSLEQYWQQFTEIAAPFRPAVEKLTPEARAQVVAEVLAALRKYWDGKELKLQLEIVIGSGTRE